MILKNVQIELDTHEIQQLLAIALDDDSEKALVFIKKKLVKQVEKALQPHWVPVFEASYGPNQTDSFSGR